jgi:hypothetical protein
MRIFLLFLLPYLCPLCLKTSFAQGQDCNFSGLQGVALELTYNSCHSPINSFPCAVPVKDVNVDVICDSPGELAIQVNYTGNSGYMKIEVYNDKREKIPSLVLPPVSRVNGNEPKTFRIKVEENVMRQFDSYEIELSIARLKSQINRINTTILRFNCQKQWCTLSELACTRKEKKAPVIYVKTTPIGQSETFSLKSNTERIVEIDNQVFPVRGISTNTIDINDCISSVEDDVDVADLLNISRQLFVDKNGQNNVFYWTPAKYSLIWDEKEGFSTQHIYSKRGVDQSILFYARVAPDVPDDIENTLQSILSACYGKAIQVKPLPVVSSPVIEQDWLALYGVTPSVSISGSDVQSSVTLEMKTDTEGITNIGVALANNIGLNGRVVFTVQSEEDFPKQEIPLEINLTKRGYKTLLPNEIQKGKNEGRYFTNTSCYPIELKKLNFLVVKPKQVNQSEVFTLQWALSNKFGKNIRIAGRSQAYFQLSDKLNSLLKDNRHTILRWVDFDILEDATCSIEIINGIVGSAFDFNTKVEVKAVPATFQSEKLIEIIVEFRSEQFSPTNQQPITKSISLSRDGDNTKEMGPFFLGGNTSQVSYEYRIAIIDTEGSKYQSTWMRSSDTRIIIGPAPLKTYIPSFKW